MLHVLQISCGGTNRSDVEASEKIMKKLVRDDSQDSGVFPLLCKYFRAFPTQHFSRQSAMNVLECIYMIIKIYEYLDKMEQGEFMVLRNKR